MCLPCSLTAPCCAAQAREDLDEWGDSYIEAATASDVDLLLGDRMQDFEFDAATVDEGLSSEEDVEAEEERKRVHRQAARPVSSCYCYSVCRLGRVSISM